MNTLGLPLYNSRLPIWFRVPALGFGLGILWFGLALAAEKFLGVGLGFSFANSQGSSLLASLACFAIATVWIFVWFAHLCIFFEAASKELIVRKRGLFRWHERRISLVNCREIQLREFRSGINGRTWVASVEFTDGRKEHVADIPVRVEAFAKALETATGLPVLQIPA